MRAKTGHTKHHGTKPHPPGTPMPHPELADMDQIHRNTANDTLADIFTKLGKK